VLQFVLIAAVLALGLDGPGWPDSVAGALRVLGWPIAIAGGLLGVVSARALGSSLTPYPRPRSPGWMVERGPYRIVRHPIYLGGILFFAGFSLALSPWALLATAALGLVWGLKSAVEERYLRDHYLEYAGYCERVRFRLVPFLY
jgi:protein-S-isoprenylcysteine O-methyltransferase Ste14